MRVIAGIWKRRKLLAPPGRSTRPLSDFVRENIFNILREQVEGASVLDLFAGSGSFGIEALSRGAADCTFVEIDRAALRALRENLQTLDARENAAVVHGDAFKAAHSLAGQEKRFDIIFCDPPFSFGSEPDKRTRIAEMVAALKSEVLSNEGTVVFRFRKGDPYENDFSAEPGDTRVYGQSAVFFFYKEADNK